VVVEFYARTDRQLTDRQTHGYTDGQD